MSGAVGFIALHMKWAEDKVHAEIIGESLVMASVLNYKTLRQLTILILIAMIYSAPAFGQDCTPNDITLNSQSEVDQFQAIHGPCDRVVQDLLIEGDDITALNGLTELTAVFGELIIEGNPSLINIDGFENLESAGSLRISNNRSLVTVDGLSSLKQIDRWLHLRFNDALRSVRGLNELTTVGNNVFIWTNFNLINLEGFSKLSQVGGALSFRILNTLFDLDDFSSLTSVGDLTISGTPIGDLDGLSNLTFVKGDVYIVGNDLISLNGLIALNSVGGDLWLQQNLQLARCSGIAQLIDQVDDAEPGPGGSSVPDVGGSILLEQNAIGCNTVEEILSEVPLLEMNAGLNDAWFNPATEGQGFLITVFPGIKQVFLAWFTYDVERPPEDVTAILGEPGHRWLTAQGPYIGNRASLDVYVTSGGTFDSSQPAPTSQPDGNIILEFSSCGRGTVKYDIHSIDWQNTVPIERIALDNVPLCESLNGQ